MNSNASLLIELGTEELPPKALPELAQAFFDGVLAGLAKRGIGFEREGARPLYSPRRLAVFVPGVENEQPTQKSEVLGPYLNIGLDASGNPTPALLGFAGKNGVAVEALGRTSDNKGERFVARSEKPGASTASLLPEIVSEALKALPVPKPMRWGAREISFVRPVHWLVMLHGGDVVDGEVLGLKADRMSRGHRFHAPKPVWLSRPEDYVDALRSAFVRVDPTERREFIRALITAAAAEVDGSAQVGEALLDEVNNLVEWPSAIRCSFERDFLAVPQEALISTMEANQKFFPVLDGAHRLTEHFIGIANIDSLDPAEVRKGYERVIRPRFADARFFFDEDCKQGLDRMAEGLASVTYQQKLGSYADKTARVRTLAGELAAALGENVEMAQRAAALSKADLQSRLVGEFPELQGIAGRYYATALGEQGEVADAIDHAYLPRFSGDGISPSKLGQVLAIAERLDTLAGGFAAGLRPSGNKDPFALRRHALGLGRTLIEAGLELNLAQWIDRALELVRADMARLGSKPEAKDSSEGAPLLDFVLDRLRGYYGDKGFTAAQFDAVAETKPVSLPDFERRLRAIAAFADLPEAPALAAANKRIRNILRKNEAPLPDAVNAALLSEPAEIALAQALDAALADTDPLLADGDYLGVLRRLACLRAPVDAFFDGVMVMAEDAAVRGNRLALLRRLADRFAAVAAVEQLSAG
jgi:glycyl-tRNA synthetase beta chain